MQHMYLLDSDFIIYYLKGKKDVVQIFDDLMNSSNKMQIYISVISIGEVMEGLQGKKHLEKLQIFNDFLKSLKISNLGRNEVEVFAKIRAKLRVKNKMISDFDVLIASTCIANDFMLLTYNKKHFINIDGLKIY